MNNYIRIVDRFSHVITGSFYGHTHKDEITLVYNKEKKPISVAYISGSLTTFSDLNPQYTIFDMDSNGKPLDSNIYLSDLDLANQHWSKDHKSSPVWRHEYSPVHSYRLQDMSPASWDKFLKEAESDLDLAFLYVGHYNRYSKEFGMSNPKNITQAEEMIKKIRRFSPFLHLDFNSGDDA